MGKITGAQMLIKCLREEGVEVIFGFPGGVVLPLFDTFPEYPKLRHILVRHEQGAAHAADAYARVTGKAGVCLATSGPGATNLVTGIANAYLDSSPIIAITGQVATSFIGKDAFQEIDITGITLPITKDNYLVFEAKDLARTVKEAFYKALPPAYQKHSTWKSIEIIPLDSGQPQITICSDTLRMLLEKEHVTVQHVSISHERKYCVASVVLEADV